MDGTGGCAGCGPESLHDAVLTEVVEDESRDARSAFGNPSQGKGVGAYLGVEAEAERVVTHRFEATIPGYSGWHWSVTLSRASRAKAVTIAEVLLLPGSEALLAPAWVPWSERVRPGDLHPGDLIPPVDDDPRLAPAYTFSDDPAVDDVCFELGVGRPQVMSREGRVWAADRWFEGDTGPNTAMAGMHRLTAEPVGFLPLTKAMSAAFGVCQRFPTWTDVSSALSMVAVRTRRLSSRPRR